MSSPDVTEPRQQPSFLHRLLVVTLSVFLVVLLVHLARELQSILQPLFIAFFLAYLILPAHTLLVRQGISPRFAFIVFLFILVVAFSLLGRLIYRNVEEAAARLPHYERRVQHILESVVERLPWDRADIEPFLQDLPALSDTLVATARTTLGRFFDFLTWMAVTLVYFVFLIAEKVSFPKKMQLAFGPDQGGRLLAIIRSINLAIAEYISVKTSVSLLTGILSVVVLGLFGVDFYMMWGILIFLLNFIPYLGSLIAVALPILLAFVQLDEAWKGIVIAVLLIAIQQVMGTVLEPRLTGQRLGVSPLLILLSLAFWGLVWGVVGMILAVPILVTTKIILDNIRETRPLAILMSNVE